MTRIIEPLVTREQFIAGLDDVQNQLNAAGVDGRIVGSLAAATYLDPEGENLNLNRPHAATQDQRYPDIDLIVPRADLPAVRECRRRLMKSSFPIKIGLAASSSTIDFRPNETVSFLTHKGIKVPVDTDVFSLRERSLMGATIPTVDANTLFHTYVTCGGRLRPKDTQKLMDLNRQVLHEGISDFPESDFAGFHEFIAMRRQNHPVAARLTRGIGAAISSVPPSLRNHLIRCALPVASVLGKR